MTNAEIADRLMSLAQLLAAKKENPFRVKAYRRAARTVRALAEGLDAAVRAEADLTAYAGIGSGIAAAIREIVLSGTSRKLETLRGEVGPEVAAISEYPRLDPARVLRIYKKLKISSVEQLKEKLAEGAIAQQMGARMEAHVRQALQDSQEILLYDAAAMVENVERFLLEECGAARVEATGEYRRRVEVVREISFLILSADFTGVVRKLSGYAGGMPLVEAARGYAVFRMASGISLKVEAAPAARWGTALVIASGSEAHVAALRTHGKISGATTEAALYGKLGMAFVEPELREGLDEISLALRDKLPDLISESDIRGELHAHSTSSDGSATIAQMAGAARARGYEYTGISDHSQSLKIAGGLSEEDLWKQIRFIDKLNAKGSGFRILKSAEVDILADGSLDYPDGLLKELDYTVCSIHSKFAMGKAEQTERILRAMDNRYFTILGHATGRLLLKRPGYEIDAERVVEQARAGGCFFEINSSPDRLDLSAGNARLAHRAGVRIAITTDAHSTREFAYLRYGVYQARRAGLDKDAVLNTRSWTELSRLLRR